MSPALIITPLLLLAAFGISFTFHGGHDVTYAPAVFLVMVAGLVCILPSLKTGFSFPRGASVLLTLAFWGYLSISLIWTTVPFASLLTWLNLTVLPIILIGVLCTPRRNELIKYCVLTLIAGTGIAALYVLWEFFVQGVGRASGPLLNPNNMAALLNLSLMPVVAYAVGGPKKHQLMTGFLMIVLFAALVATGSRGGLLCFITGSAVVGFALYQPVMTAWKPAVGLVALLVTVFAGFYFFTPSMLAQSLPILGDATIDYSSFERVEIWKGALAMIQAHWMGGTGLGTFYLYYPAFRLDSDGASLGHWAHFDALQFSAETGILAMILFYAAMGAWLARGVSSLIKLPAGDSRRALIAGCLTGLLTLAIHSHIEFQFYVMANLMVAAVLMAALYVLTVEDASFVKVDLATHDRFIWSGALIVAALLVSFTLISSAAGIHYLNRANAAFNKADMDGFTKNIALSRRYSPRSFADADVQLAGLYVDLLIQQTGQMNDADRLTAYRDGLQLLEEAQMANPAWADIDHKRAKLYSRIDDVNEPDHKAMAIAAWTQALQKDPLHYHAREEFARYLIKQGRVEDAFNVLQDGLHRPITAPARAAMMTLSAQIEPLVAVKRQYQNQPK